MAKHHWGLKFSIGLVFSLIGGLAGVLCSGKGIAGGILGGASGFLVGYRYVWAFGSASTLQYYDKDWGTLLGLACATIIAYS